MQVYINEDISLDFWQNLINKSCFSSPFQTFEFYKFINSVPGFSAIAIGIENSEGLIALVVAILQKEKGIKGYFSSRGIIYGGPLILEGYAEALPILFEEINTQLKYQTIYIEIRNYNDYSNYKKLFAEYGWIYQPHLNFHLNCSSREIIWNNLNTNRKRQINKATKKGVKIKEAVSLNEIKEFYLILRDLYAKKIRKPLPALEFFEAFFINAVGVFLLVHYKNKIIGGIMCIGLSGKAIYEFYICGLDEEYKDASPSVMATFAGIEYAYNNGFKYFDFMGAGKPDDNYGVREFKKKFGGEIMEHGRFLKINKMFLFKLGRLIITLSGKLK